jgi:hypothetical protein
MAPWLIIAGFCIGWLGLLTFSFKISLNHNQLRELTINLQPIPSFLPDEDCIHSDCRSTTPCNWTTLLFLIGTDHAQKTQLFYCYVRVYWGSRVITTQPAHWRAGSCLTTVSAWSTIKTPLFYFWPNVCLNVFTEPFRSTGSVRHSMIKGWGSKAREYREIVADRWKDTEVTEKYWYECRGNYTQWVHKAFFTFLHANLEFL